MMNKKIPFNCLSVDIDLKELEILLVETIPRYCAMKQTLFVKRSKMYGDGLADRYISQDLTADENELDEIQSILTLFLDGSPQSLPLMLVKQIHSFIGHIKGMQESYDDAIRSFLKVLWIDSRLNGGRRRRSLCNSYAEIPSGEENRHIHITLTTHRLALMHGKNGNYQEAISLLEKVINDYKKYNVKKNCSIHENAKEALSIFRASSNGFPTTNSKMMPFKSNAAKGEGFITVESIRNMQRNTIRRLSFATRSGSNILYN